MAAAQGVLELFWDARPALSAASLGQTNMAETPQTPTNTIPFDDFAKVRLRIGRVIEAGYHPNADKLLVLKVDLGDEQRQICAGLRGHYEPDELIDRNLVMVTNLAPRMMRGLESQGMLLAASTPDHEKVVILTTEREIKPGSTVS